MSKTKHYRLPIIGMQCIDCENNIEEAVSALPGVVGARANFTQETLTLDLDTDVVSVKTVCAAIKARGYRCGNRAAREVKGLIKRIAIILIGLAGILLLLQLKRVIPVNFSFDTLDEHSGYGLIFLIGILSSFHCIGMCGGFVLSYSAAGAQTGRPAYLTHFYYGVGKTVSYAAMGALFGFIGGAINFTIGMQSIAMGLAGAFLVMYGLSLLEAFSGLRRFHIRLPRILVHRINETRRRLSNPLAIGLLNGLMIACGPLQAMYIMAAGNGSPVQGAALLSVFALGTLPVLFLFGLLSTLMTSNATLHLLKTSGVIILLLGAVMLNRSLLLSGTGYDVNSLLTRVSEASAPLLSNLSRDDSKNNPHIQEGYQIIYTEAESYRYLPSLYYLKTNVPVKWIINVKKLSPCNQRIIVPDLNMAIDLKEGFQMVEFLPRKAGTIGWSCSMGMIPGTFIVKD